MALPTLTMPAVNMSATRWRFDGNSAAIRALAATWARLAESADHGQAMIGRAAPALTQSWQGPASGAYQAHRQVLDPDILAIAAAADHVVAALDSAAEAVAAAQVRLAGLLAVASGLGPIDHGSAVITFHPVDPIAAGELNALAGQADDARNTAEQALTAAADAIDGCLAGLDRVGRSWEPRPGTGSGRGGIVTNAPGRVYWEPLAGAWRVELDPDVVAGVGEGEPGGETEPAGGEEPAGGAEPAQRSALSPVIGPPWDPARGWPPIEPPIVSPLR